MLWETGAASEDESLRLHTRSGILTAARSGGLIELDFPALESRPAEAPPEILLALGGLEPVAVRHAGPDAAGETNFLVELAGEEEVRGLDPDLSGIDHPDGPGLLITATSRGSDQDFVSRYFIPSFGIDEDPVTGAAHCLLAPYWTEKLGRDELMGYQASERGGFVRVRVDGDRVHLGGEAVTISRGELRV